MKTHRRAWQLHDLYDRIERETVAALPQPPGFTALGPPTWEGTGKVEAASWS
ncbi:MAG: hypothetical protein AB1696_28105 [Planctomycetota bacterium]